MKLKLRLRGLYLSGLLGLYLYGTCDCDEDAQMDITTANHNSVGILDNLMQGVSA
jgi:hypothetical protein